jgi:hypothetical protein
MTPDPPDQVAELGQVLGRLARSRPWLNFLIDPEPGRPQNEPSGPSPVSEARFSVTLDGAKSDGLSGQLGPSHWLGSGTVTRSSADDSHLLHERRVFLEL